MSAKAARSDTGPRTGAQNPPARRRRRRAGRGALWLIAALFVASGLMRLGGETGRAIASGLADAVVPADHAGESGCEPPADIALVLAALQARETGLREREAAFSDREQALKVAEAQIEANLAALREAEASLEATMALSATAAEDDLARLTSVYESMKPKEATPLFAAMDPEFAAGFLARMRPDAAAAILAGLEPGAAYAVSVLLAGRNARAATE